MFAGRAEILASSHGKCRFGNGAGASVSLRVPSGRSPPPTMRSAALHNMKTSKTNGSCSHSRSVQTAELFPCLLGSCRHGERVVSRPSAHQAMGSGHCVQIHVQSPYGIARSISRRRPSVAYDSSLEDQITSNAMAICQKTCQRLLEVICCECIHRNIYPHDA